MKYTYIILFSLICFSCNDDPCSEQIESLEYENLILNEEVKSFERNFRTLDSFFTKSVLRVHDLNKENALLKGQIFMCRDSLSKCE